MTMQSSYALLDFSVGHPSHPDGMVSATIDASGRCQAEWKIDAREPQHFPPGYALATSSLVFQVPGEVVSELHALLQCFPWESGFPLRPGGAGERTISWAESLDDSSGKRHTLTMWYRQIYDDTTIHAAFSHLKQLLTIASNGSWYI